MESGRPEPVDHGHAMLELAQESVMWREVEDEVIVLDKRTWNYMGINGSGALLWKKIARGASTADLVRCLCESYEIDEQLAARDVEAFLGMLGRHDLLLNKEE